MAGIQLVGNVNNTTAQEVEVNTKAARVVIRPDDFGSLGIYGVGGISGTMAAVLAAAADIFQFRWTSTTNFCLIKSVSISAGSVAAMTTAQGAGFNLNKVTAWTADGSGGTTLTPAAGQNKLRTSMGSTGVGSIRIASTAALTNGTRTVDTTAIAGLAFGITTTAGVSYITPSADLFRSNAGDYPFILSPQASNFEGFVIQNSILMGAGGTFTFAVKVIWEELTAY